MDSLYQNAFHPQLLANALRQDPEMPCLIHDGGIVTRGQLAEAVGRYINALTSAGLRPGDRIAILSDNRPEVLYVLWAAVFLRCTFAPLHPFGTAEDYIAVLDDVGIGTIVYAPEPHGGKASQVEERAPGRFRFLSLGPGERGEDLIALAAIQDAAKLEPPALAGDEIFQFVFTGGTTGRPKAVPLTYKMVRTMTIIQMSEWEWPAEIRQLVCAPLSHSGAPLFLPTLLRGGYVHLLPAFDALQVMQAVEKHRINCMLMVPTMICALLDHPEFDNHDLSSLETVFYGAAPISPVRLDEAIARFGPIFYQFYGQAEAPMSMIVMRRREHVQGDLARLACCGRPVPWVDVQLLDEQGEPVADGVPGEICVRGALVMPGYHNQPELTAETLRNGWLHTGDLAVRGPDGFLRIAGRNKDMIITGGFNVYAREVENALEEHPAVAASAVFGVPHDYWGELVTAAVVVHPGRAVTSDQLIAHVRQLKGSVQAPKQIVFIDEIPLTAVGKPNKKALRSAFGD